jgi:hypothetical protein
LRNGQRLGPHASSVLQTYLTLEIKAVIQP